MGYKAVIFDLDGVICRTDAFHYRAWKALTDRLGIPFDETVNDRLRGVSRMESLEILLEKSEKTYTTGEKEAFAAEKNELYRSFLCRMTPDDLSEEVQRTLMTLRERDVKLAIGSSSKNTRLILSRLGLADFFDAVADGTEITRSKPDPEVFLLAARKLGAAPGDAIVVEDAVSGIRAAKAGGFFAVGIGSAANCPEADRGAECLTPALFSYLL